MKVKCNMVGNGAVRVTIPLPIRQALGIEAGDVLDVVLYRKTIVMEKVA